MDTAEECLSPGIKRRKSFTKEVTMVPFRVKAEVDTSVLSKYTQEGLIFGSTNS